MKKLLSLALCLSMFLALSACGDKPQDSSAQPSSGFGGASSVSEAPSGGTGAKPVELHVFAAASMTETLDQIIEQYKSVAPNVTIVPTYDSSGTLLTQIQEGADCDLFISAAQKQMDALGESGGLLEGTRADLLENKVALAVPDGNPKGIESFDRLAELLKAGEVSLAMGNSDVPVGQYTQKIFAYYGLDEEALAAAGVLTYGSNVKEVATHVSEAAVDCGIIYGTDAVSANLTVVDTATAGMCGQVVYPAAVLNLSLHPGEAADFLDYLKSEAAGQVFEGVGFSPIR